ncbi:MAG TPA: protease complex subunit PrcB family protein [Solimonas sp.]|nr:protease complex subunit PrcB family protein [Solimonas sp.]
MKPDMKKLPILLVLLVLSGCAHMPDVTDWFSRENAVSVSEVRRAIICGTSGPEAQVTLFPDAAAVQAWELGRGLQMSAGTPLPATPFVLVEMGERSSAGYGLAVSRTAGRRGEDLILRATFLSPAPGRMTAQMITSPCVLVSIPQANYRAVEVIDQGGTLRATTERK